jgi:SAM-dependent methyltransferase
MDPAVIQLHAEIEDRHWWFVARRTILRSLLHAVVPPSADATIVDVGCGTGGNAAALARDYHVVGIDPSELAIGLARSRFPEVEFVVGSAEEAVSMLERADAVLLTDVIEHVEDDFGFVASILSSLPVGAHALITVPARPELWSRHDIAHHHFRRYTPERLSAVWDEHPVAVRLLSYYNARLYPLAAISRQFGKRLAGSSAADGRELGVPAEPVNRLFERVFAGERDRLLRVLAGRGRGYGRGLSLIALLERVAENGSEAGRRPARSSAARET